ncbi:PepSY domain-containing protein [uncultured Alteromonas sp.]|jgi:ferredoxin|uniref:PepSY domain-containing protein n=1 Tax=uncultured Alteromonas sp. TaxID=179113 RepID=UPI0025F8B904|nr:PepSY domain-containing protein [uncultured Alteromonas sp.]
MMRLLMANWHKWLALLVFMQLLIWLTTGLYFNSLMDSADNVTTERLVQHEGYLPGRQLYPVQAIAAPPPVAISLVWVLGSPYYQFDYNQPLHDYYLKQRRLFNATTGVPWQISPEQIAKIAEQAYSGRATGSKPVLISPPIDDLPRQQNPLWQVRFADEYSTAIYLDALTGHVIKHTNDRQRFDDLMFTLHFMDYSGSGFFNHPLIIVFATATCLLSLSGGYLLIFGSRQRPAAQSATPVTLTINFASTAEPARLEVRPTDTVFNALSKHNIELPSECGGAGTCGKCRVQCSADTPVNDVEHYHLSEQQLASGIRLGCQQLTGTCQQLQLPYR